MRSPDEIRQIIQIAKDAGLARFECDGLKFEFLSVAGKTPDEILQALEQASQESDEERGAPGYLGREFGSFYPPVSLRDRMDKANRGG